MKKKRPASRERGTMTGNERLFARRLEELWAWCEELNTDTGIEPPDSFFDWFDEDGCAVARLSDAELTDEAYELPS